MSFQVMSGSPEEHGEWSGQQHRRGGGHCVGLYHAVGELPPQVHHGSAVCLADFSSTIRIQGH